MHELTLGGKPLVAVKKFMCLDSTEGMTDEVSLRQVKVGQLYAT